MKTKLIYIALGAVLVLAGVLSWVILRPSERQLIEIVQDGTVLQQIDLARAENQVIRIDSADGSSYNLVCIESGTVRISEAACPDQTCVHMGVLRSDSLPIVCLPNRLIVRFAEGTP